MRISDWSSDVCCSDLQFSDLLGRLRIPDRQARRVEVADPQLAPALGQCQPLGLAADREVAQFLAFGEVDYAHRPRSDIGGIRSEEHTSELQSLMRISYAVFCLKKTIRYIMYNDISLYNIMT